MRRSPRLVCLLSEYLKDALNQHAILLGPFSAPCSAGLISLDTTRHTGCLRTIDHLSTHSQVGLDLTLDLFDLLVGSLIPFPFMQPTEIFVDSGEVLLGHARSALAHLQGKRYHDICCCQT